MPAKKTDKKPEVKKSAARGASSSKGTSSRGAAAKNTASKPVARAAREGYVQEEERSPSSVQLSPYVLAIAAVLLGAFMLFSGSMGIIGQAVRAVTFGLFSWPAVFIPVLMLIIAFYLKRDVENGGAAARTVAAVVCLLCLSVLSYAFAYHSYGGSPYQFLPSEWWKDGLDLRAGGFIGGVLGWLLHKCVSYAGTLIIVIALLLLFLLRLFGQTPYSFILTLRYKLHVSRERARLEKERIDGEFAEKEAEQARIRREAEERAAAEKAAAPKYDPDVCLDEDEEKERGTDALPIDKDIYERIVNDTGDCVTYDETIAPFDADGDSVIIGGTVLKRTGGAPSASGTPDLSSDADGGLGGLLDDGDEEEEPLIKEQAPAVQTSAKAEQEKKRTKKERAYRFPPLSLLQQGADTDTGDHRRELAETSAKLVRTLESFKVKTKVMNISRGPTITRYELAPEEGVRVRSIVNLVDDISLSLAATGVRIEAPIPGKQAVGIEVPNKQASTVYLRRLIDAPKFKQAQSKVHCALGEDVAGEPIYLDVAKMPHLLIAGATGMGKSVCINSIIVSMLYKASPEDVKLMLIDPKKVEFNLYNDLPHLLIPPVSDSKRAAGALQWAVAEMERRYGLIEDVGVRNISSYNQATANDPEREHLPLIVIIIDELADLMMSSPDIVEESICRLAQKARAAGIHLVIGTQRPSVDVVTGLIKANIPSRIAFTVASITDSRVILDYGGAEKLIGRGDMLFAPVGSPKPVRVQGAFVSDEEVEAVVNFIRDNNGELEYDEGIVDEIVELAKNCDSGKKGGYGADANISGADAEDPMLRAAIELAVESGKISTSLIQRKLSLGYGRAAKLIDEMEQRGIVSAPEGQKPRNVLISKTEYMEMVLRQEQ